MAHYLQLTTSAVSVQVSIGIHKWSMKIKKMKPSLSSNANAKRSVSNRAESHRLSRKVAAYCLRSSGYSSEHVTETCNKAERAQVAGLLLRLRVP